MIDDALASETLTSPPVCARAEAARPPGRSVQYVPLPNAPVWTLEQLLGVGGPDLLQFFYARYGTVHGSSNKAWLLSKLVGSPPGGGGRSD